MDYLSKVEQARIRLLGKKRERMEQGRFIAEGLKVCKELLGSSITIQYAVISDDANDQALHLAEEFEEAGIEVCKAGTSAFERMCDAQTPQDIFCIAELPNIEHSMPDCFLALEDINDPGNLGTILRTADWFGLHSIILGGTCADPFGPKALRSAMGSTFRLNIQTTEDLPGILQSWKKNYADGEILGMIVHGNHTLQDLNELPKHWGMIVGSESHGLSKHITDLITLPIRIDGLGTAESLNVGIATGISLYHCCTMLKKQ